MLEPGDRIDIWVIEKRLGAGGMGSVYRCHNHAAQRILAAIKILEAHVANHPEARRRFIREAEILFTLAHPNIVQVRNVRVDAKAPYIEMEFVKGESIEDYLAREGGMPLSMALPMMGQLASALAYLHSQGVRHRDIKPANLLITEQSVVKLVDFGLAMEADVSRLTQGNMSFGTVSYAPPEWVDPDKLDPILWDMYALGVVYWEMLTGDVAFPVTGEGNARQQAFQVILKKQGHAPLDPGQHYPDEVRAVIRDLTHPDPAMRLADAAALVRRLAKTEGVGPLPEPPTISRAPTPRRAPDPTIIPRDGTGETYTIDSAAARATTPPPPPNAGPTLVVPPSDSDPPAAFMASPNIEPPETPPLASAPTLLRADIEPPAQTRRRGGLGLLLGGGVALLALVGAGAVGAVVWMSGTPGARAVEIDIGGLPDDAAFDVMLGDRVPASRDGTTVRFSDVSPGTYDLSWVVGDGCEALPCARGRCAEWCLAGEREIRVDEGDGVASVSVALAAPEPRPIRVGTSDVAAGVAVAIAVEGIDGAMDGRTFKANAVAPGRYRARVILGDCPQGDPCEDACPPGCRDAVRELVVPVGDGRHEARLQVAPPEKRPPGSSIAPSGGSRPGSDDTPDGGTPGAGSDATPTDGGADAGGTEPDDGTTHDGTAEPATARPLVTNAAYSRWLAQHPEWTQAQATTNGIADENYLFGWAGDSPPAGQERRPVQNVPHMAARAYCQGRGGLPSVSDSPTSWDEGSVGLGFEWRLQGDQAASLESNGRASTAVRRGQSLLGTGFRCKR